MYDPERHRPENELRFANAALLNAAIAFVRSDQYASPEYAQLKIEVENVARLRVLDPLLGGHFEMSNLDASTRTPMENAINLKGM